MGQESLVGQEGVARTDLAPEGTVHVAGEMWTAHSEDGQITEGERVRVVAVDGLHLRVRRLG
jgi:membrane-bound serine protease (ClpP class)